MDQRVQRGLATKEALIAAARTLFGERGYEATSIDAVLTATGVARGALYHHFATKAELFDAVLDREVAKISEAAAQAARAADYPLDSLRSGCETWLRLALDPAVQRITLLDSPAVVGWTRWRELDEQHLLGGLQTSIRRIAGPGQVPAEQSDVLAHMVAAAVGEAALLIARAEDRDAALHTGLAALNTMLDRLFGPGPASG